MVKRKTVRSQRPHKKTSSPLHHCYDYSLIVINYHCLSQLTQSLSSWLKFHSPTQEKYKIIIWNNNSLPDQEAKGLAQLVKNLSAQVPTKIVNYHHNIGFARANNQAAQIAKGNFLIFLNADTLITQNIFQPLARLYSQLSYVGALSPTILLSDGKTPQPFSSGDFPTLANTLFQTAKKQAHNLSALNFSSKNHSWPQACDWVSGACLFISQKVFQRINGFDPQFFLYFEDIDLCRRLSKFGYQNYVAPAVKIIHLGGGSFLDKNSSKQLRAYDTSQDLYFAKHFPAWQGALIKIARQFYRKR